jgi:O-antigen ligase
LARLRAALSQALLPHVIERRFALLFVAFLALGYIVRPNPLWAGLFFYASLLPAMLLLLWRDASARTVLRDRLVLLCLALMGWYWATLFWGYDQPPRRVQGYAVGIPLNAAFVLCCVLFFARAEEAWLRRLLAALVIAAALNATFSIGSHVALGLHHVQGARLAGWAETRHPILGAGVMGVGLQAACLLALLLRNRRWAVLALAAGGLCALAFIIVTGSRGPVLAIAAFLLVFGLVVTGWRGALAGAAMLGVAVVAILVLFGPDWVLHQLNRPSHRLPIWEVTLARIAERPLLGHGVANHAIFGDPYFTFPHSLYLSALYYGGAIGAALLLAILAGALRRAATLADRRWRAFALAALASPMVFGLTDLGQPAVGPSELWYVLWLPVGAAIGLAMRKAAPG